MLAFKVYVLRDDGHVISQVDLFCNVGQAKEWAKALVDDKPVELGDGSIRIARSDAGADLIWWFDHSAPTLRQDQAAIMIFGNQAQDHQPRLNRLRDCGSFPS